MRKSLLMATAAVAVIAGGAALVRAQGMMGGYGEGYGNGPGSMMGSPGQAGAFGMMSGYANRPVYPGWGGDVVNYRQAAAFITEGDDAGSVNKQSNTISYAGKDITINMVAVQPDHDDQTFEVHGLTNPTLVVPRGATVHLTLVNMDYGNNMEHSVVLTTAAPPYPYMSMMGTGPELAQIAPLLPWRSEKTIDNAQYAMLGTTFVAQEPGTYWYLCPTPDHAKQGMFGKFVVL